MERAMQDLKPKAWLRGIRRNQSDTRRTARFMEWSNRYGAHAISPLLNRSDGARDAGPQAQGMAPRHSPQPVGYAPHRPFYGVVKPLWGPCNFALAEPI